VVSVEFRRTIGIDVKTSSSCLFCFVFFFNIFLKMENFFLKFPSKFSRTLQKVTLQKVNLCSFLLRTV